MSFSSSKFCFLSSAWAREHLFMYVDARLSWEPQSPRLFTEPFVASSVYPSDDLITPGLSWLDLTSLLIFWTETPSDSPINLEVSDFILLISWSSHSPWAWAFDSWMLEKQTFKFDFLRGCSLNGAGNLTFLTSGNAWVSTCLLITFLNF